jgi:hypothetical protein
MEVTMAPQFDAKDQQLLNSRIAAWSKRSGPRVGDFVILPGEEHVRRFTHDWDDDIQTTSGIGREGRFYFSHDGFMDFSGGLDSPIRKD